MSSSQPASRQRVTIGSVWFDIQEMARWIGSPVRRSQSTTVSREVVMPIAARSRAVAPTRDMASSMASRWDCQTRTGSSSTQPGCGNTGTTGRRASLTIWPSGSISTARALEVPSSRVST